MNTKEILLGLAIGVLAALLVVGCDEETVGWDPATMRCRAWVNGAPEGPFLKDEACAGQAKPVELQPEVQ